MVEPEIVENELEVQDTNEFDENYINRSTGLKLPEDDENSAEFETDSDTEDDIDNDNTDIEDIDQQDESDSEDDEDNEDTDEDLPTSKGKQIVTEQKGKWSTAKKVAVIGGGLFGDQCSPISDTTVLSSTGASCNHVVHVKTQLPYGLTVGGCAAIGFLIGGLTGQYVLSVIVAAILLLVALVVMSKAADKKGAIA